MIHAVRRYAILIAGAVACSLVLSTLAPMLQSPRGAMGPTVLQAQSPVKAVLATLVAFGLAVVIATAVGRLINAVVGLFTLGAGLMVLSMRLVTFREIAFGGESLILLAVEALVWAGLLLAACVIVFRLSGPLEDVEPPESGEPPSPWGPDALVAALAGALVLPVVWIVAQSPMSGQTIGAVFVGSMVAGLVGRLLRPHVQPMLIFVTPVVFGAIGILIGAALTPKPLEIAYVDGAVSPLLLPMPVHYAAGALLGVSMGLGWARSFLQHEE